MSGRWTHSLAMLLGAVIPAIVACTGTVAKDVPPIDGGGPALDSAVGADDSRGVDETPAVDGGQGSTNPPVVVAPGDDGGHCCPPDPTPGCCMHYGGWNAYGCGVTCDGMPQPDDPAWRLVTDDHECSIWSSEGSTGPLCGQPRFPDASVDAEADAPMDGPTADR